MKVVIIFLSLLLSLNTLHAQNKKNILVLLSFHTTLPWTKQFVSGLEDYANTNPDNFEFYMEQIDAFRLKGGADEKSWVNFIKDKYKNIKLDGIIVESDIASNLYDKTSELLYPDIPTIVLSNSSKSGDIKLEINLQKLAQMNIDLAMTHNKNLQYAYIIDSSFSEAVEIKEELLKSFSKTKVKPIVIENFTKASLLDKVKKLPKNSALFYTILFEDANKERFIPKEILKEITAVSNTPVYIFYSSQLDAGALGGITQDAQTAAKNMLYLLDEYLHNNTNPKPQELFSKVIDWKVMKKFGISPKNNPKGVTFLNKPTPVWESYPNETLFSLVVLFLLILLILMLIALGIRNKKIATIEKQMLIQSRHAAMGEMLNAIAHQWRQPLNALYMVMQNYRLIMKKRGVEDENLQRLELKADNLIAQMSQTIDDFKDFFKPKQNKISFKPKDELLRSIDLIDISFSKENIQIELLSLSDALAFGYPNELGQCFLNIMQNAKDELKKISHNRLLKIQMEEKNNNITIIFTDNANGIDEKILTKIFEPYFTTKPQSGTGIGLYMSKMIIEENMNGRIFAQNLKEGGAKFTITLPKERQIP